MQRYFVKEKKDNLLELEKSDLHHLKNVMRYKVGDKIECVYEKNLYICSIDDLSSCWVSILSEEKGITNPKKISIAVGMVKEQKFDLILQKLTELGIDEIIPLKMERSIVKLGTEKIEKKLERWKKICKEAAEQSKRNDIPTVHVPITIEELKNMDYEQKFVCSTKKQNKLNYNYLHQFEKCATMIFVIGPEGGISDQEENTLVSSGYSKVSFGDQIMRVETATIYVASILQFMK